MNVSRGHAAINWWNNHLCNTVPVLEPRSNCYFCPNCYRSQQSSFLFHNSERRHRLTKLSENVLYQFLMIFIDNLTAEDSSRRLYDKDFNRRWLLCQRFQDMSKYRISNVNISLNDANNQEFCFQIMEFYDEIQEGVTDLLPESFEITPCCQWILTLQIFSKSGISKLDAISCLQAALAFQILHTLFNRRTDSNHAALLKNLNLFAQAVAGITRCQLLQSTAFDAFPL